LGDSSLLEVFASVIHTLSMLPLVFTLWSERRTSYGRVHVCQLRFPTTVGSEATVFYVVIPTVILIFFVFPIAILIPTIIFIVEITKAIIIVTMRLAIEILTIGTRVKIGCQ
jgi:hypothetical protein